VRVLVVAVEILGARSRVAVVVAVVVIIIIVVFRCLSGVCCGRLCGNRDGCGWFSNRDGSDRYVGSWGGDHYSVIIIIALFRCLSGVCCGRLCGNRNGCGWLSNRHSGDRYVGSWGGDVYSVNLGNADRLLRDNRNSVLRDFWHSGDSVLGNFRDSRYGVLRNFWNGRYGVHWNLRDGRDSVLGNFRDSRYGVLRNFWNGRYGVHWDLRDGRDSVLGGLRDSGSRRGHALGLPRVAGLARLAASRLTRLAASRLTRLAASRLTRLAASRLTRLAASRLTRLAASRLTRLATFGLAGLAVVRLAGISSVASAVGLSSRRAGWVRCGPGSRDVRYIVVIIIVIAVVVVRNFSRVSRSGLRLSSYRLGDNSGGCGLSSHRHGSLGLSSNRNGSHRLGGCGLGTGRLGVTVTVARSARASSIKRDLNTLVLSRSRGGVDVVLAVIVDGAGVKGSASVVCDTAAGTDSEAGSRGGSNIALELGGRWSEDASAAVGVGETTAALAVVAIAVAGQAIAASRVTITTDAVLTITELAENTSGASRCLELVACRSLTSDEGVGTKAERYWSESVSHVE
jgi:hypothetical protein